MPDQEPQFDTLPPAIIDALREIDGPAVMPDAERDADVFSGARRHLAQVHRKRRNLRLFFAGSGGGALAAAAMIVFVVWLGNPFAPQQSADMESEINLSEAIPTTADPPKPGDVDRSGNVDILDAYALAKEVKHGRPAPMRDLNNDGQVDQRDIDWIASRVVTLNHGEPG